VLFVIFILVFCEKSQKTRISVYLKYGIILMHFFGSREDNFSNETFFFYSPCKFKGIDKKYKTFVVLNTGLLQNNMGDGIGKGLNFFNVNQV